jgi:hypothetical protein
MRSQPRSGGDLEDHPTAAGAKGTAVAAEVCSAVEISRRVTDQTRNGSCPVGSAGETVQHGLPAGLIQLKRRSKAVIAAKLRGAVRLPAASLIRAPLGENPSVPPLPPVKVYSTLSLPVVSTLNTVPELKGPPSAVVP